MIDRYEVGERQTSACATPTDWLINLGLMGAHRQTFDELVIHTPHTSVRYELPWSFSTFDYPELCALLCRSRATPTSRSRRSTGAPATPSTPTAAT